MSDKLIERPAEPWSIEEDLFAEWIDYAEALETKLSKMEEAANQAEMLLDAMAIDGIRSSLTVPVQQLYSSVHVALQKALATEEEAV